MIGAGQNFTQQFMTSTTIIFRVDSSSVIGMGHLQRCLALASQLKNLGYFIAFVCRDHEGSAHNLVNSHGFRLYLLPGKTEREQKRGGWLGFSQRDDAEAMNQILQRFEKVKVIVDHYSLDADWEVRIKADVIAIIDDLANRTHCKGLLIDQSLVKEKSDYEPFFDQPFEFIGGKQIILRDEFCDKENWQLNKNKRLFICMGGADPKNVSLKILKLLLNNFESSSQNWFQDVQLVLGPSNPHQDQLLRLLENKTIPLSIITNATDISDMMLNADLNILSCGTMIFEACALGVPTIGVSVADNQLETAEFLKKSLSYNYLTMILVTSWKLH